MDSNVQTLCTHLSNGEADTTEMARLYVDVLDELATIPVLVNYVTVTPSSGAVTFPTTSLTLLLAFYNSNQLGELSIREADWLLPNWRAATGTPYNYVMESYGRLGFQLVPTPTDGHNAQLLTTYYTDTLPTWLQMPVALLVLAREYERESDHQNLELATACRQLGNYLVQLVVTKVS